MRIITQGYGDKTSQKYQLFLTLIQECLLSSTGYKLSSALRRKIEEYDKDHRKNIVDRISELGCSPLFLASKNGSAEVVEYLIDVCDADIELRGRFEVADEGVSHSVTPLWCAAVSGRLSVVKILITRGAEVNAVSDSGSTPVRSACYIVRNGLNTSHFEIIKCLVKSGGNIQTPNHFGGTCLINSVQSPELVSFLIDNDVEIDAEDVQHKTALHYAVQENRLESAKLLIKCGANPMKQSKYGDDILQTTCLKGSLLILNYLLENIMYDPERIAEAFELIGSTFVLDFHDIGSAIFFWRKALEIRYEGQFRQYPKLSVKHPILNVYEIDSHEELNVIIGDVSAMKTQALIITERVLGPCHKDTIFRYMYCGAANADSNQYRNCVLLWNYALKLKIQKETLLSYDATFTARAIVQLFVNIMKKSNTEDEFESDLKFNDILQTAELITDGMPECTRLLKIRPIFNSQAENFDVVMTSWLHVLHVLICLSNNYEQMVLIYNIVKETLQINPKTFRDHNSLLHLVTSSSNSLATNGYIDEGIYSSIFPSFQVIQFILMCGYDIHTRNSLLETPLHIASKKENYTEKVSILLLENGAHVDIPDIRGISPLDIFKSHSCKIKVMSFLSLKCLSANVIKKNKILYNSCSIPRDLHNFVNIH